eukprot:50794-Rhodomonas_salina.1
MRLEPQHVDGLGHSDREGQSHDLGRCRQEKAMIEVDDNRVMIEVEASSALLAAHGTQSRNRQASV